MAAFRGITTNSNLSGRLDYRDYLSNLMQTADQNTFDPAVYSVSVADTGLYAGGRPVTARHLYQALDVASVNTPFYQGVYFQQEAVIINGAVLDVGLISQADVYGFQLWVTFPFKATVESVGILDTDAGLSVTNISAGDILGAYQELTVEVLAEEDGASSINTFFYIKYVDNPTIYVLQITGARVSRFYLLEPNWADSVTVEKRYLTSVFQSLNMTETRKVLRDRPVRSLSATVPFYNKQSAGASWSNVRNAVANTSILPWWPDLTKMTADQAGFRIYCPTEYRRFQADGYAYLASAPLDYADLVFDVVKILTVYADGFEVYSATQHTYETGAKVYPCYVADAQMDGLDTDLFTDRSGTVALTAFEKYGPDMLERENNEYSPDTSKGYPVMPLTVTFSESVSITINTGGEAVSSGRGTRLDMKGIPYVSLQSTVIAKTKEECWQVEGFFNHLQGRGKPFWVYSELDFLSIVSTPSPTVFIIDNINYLTDLAYLTYCWVTDTNGDFEVLRVLDIIGVPEGIQITVEVSSLVDISSVRQAHAVRLAEDVVSTEYLTDSVALTTFTTQELQQAGGV